MKRALILVFLAAMLAAVLPAQHEAAAEHGEAAHDGGDPMLGWKIANFVLLAGGLGYLIYKKAGGFFTSRTGQIRRGLEEAAKVRADAEARYAETERRLAGIDAEIKSLRERAHSESAAEADRIRQETGQQVDKIRAQAEQEISSTGKAAQQELRAYAAGLAVGLAERRIRERMTPDTDRVLVSAVVQDLARQTDRSEVRPS